MATLLHVTLWGSSPKGDYPRVARFLLERGANAST